MKLLLDEMHTSAAAVELRVHGPDVASVQERADLRGLADEDILIVAAGEGRAVVTENVKDFAPLDRRWAAEGREHAGLVFTSPTRYNRARLAYPGDLVAALAAFVADAPVSGTSWTWWL